MNFQGHRIHKGQQRFKQRPGPHGPGSPERGSRAHLSGAPGSWRGRGGGWERGHGEPSLVCVPSRLGAYDSVHIVCMLSFHILS